MYIYIYIHICLRRAGERLLLARGPGLRVDGGRPGEGQMGINK